MSRIGRKPIAIPAGVDVTIADGNVVTVKGPKGTLTETFNGRMTITKEGNEIHVTRPTDEKEDRAIHGLTRTLIHNRVEGVTNGFSKKLEINGVGYRAQKAGKTASGEFATEHAVKSGKAALVIVSDESSDNTKKKFQNMCDYYEVPVYFYGGKEELGHAMGKEFRASLAILDEGLAKSIEKNLRL